MTIDAAAQRFLDTREVVVLATLQPDGSPLAMPMWFLHDAQAITMLSVDGLRKVKNLRRDPRVSVVGEAHDAAGIRGVVVQGRAEFLEDGPERRALVERFLTKYAGRLETLWGGRAMPANRVMFRIAPAKVRTWGL
ncbi:MAG: TIGR03618 family F420-dependent PPOX class oxidoreductase [Candidatus Rokubacteria bacterium]|nr:TIGR03618 family F420-dependent PPOX class oxidoreductase [Candidatus Rokubacteria bacterium]